MEWTLLVLISTPVSTLKTVNFLPVKPDQELLRQKVLLYEQPESMVFILENKYATSSI